MDQGIENLAKNKSVVRSLINNHLDIHYFFYLIYKTFAFNLLIINPNFLLNSE